MILGPHPRCWIHGAAGRDPERTSRQGRVRRRSPLADEGPLETTTIRLAFTTAICSLAILWPLQRITDAQRVESRRLLGLDDRDTR